MERAESLVRKALSLKPEDGYVLDSVGWVLFQQGKTEEALSFMEKAMEKIKTDPIIAEHYGDVLLASGKKAEAADAYRKSLQANPENLVVQDKLKKLE